MNDNTPTSIEVGGSTTVKRSWLFVVFPEVVNLSSDLISFLA